jgi:hypothetical protein
MVYMKLSGGFWPKSAVPSVMLALLMGLTLVGCSQHGATPAPGEIASMDQHLPFDGRSDKAGIFPTGSLTPTAIPAGTPLAVHLQTSLSSATARPGDTFEATLDEPILIRGRVVAPRGAKVAGIVLDARPGGDLQEAGYMRLALTAVDLNGQSLSVQTSSIFVKRGSHAKRTLNQATGFPTVEVSRSQAVISKASLSERALSGKSMSEKSTSKKSNVSLGRVKGTLIGASTEPAGMEADYPIENKDVRVAPERRLTFRLAVPLPL